MAPGGGRGTAVALHPPARGLGQLRPVPVAAARPPLDAAGLVKMHHHQLGAHAAQALAQSGLAKAVQPRIHNGQVRRMGVCPAQCLVRVGCPVHERGLGPAAGQRAHPLQMFPPGADQQHVERRGIGRSGGGDLHGGLSRAGQRGAPRAWLHCRADRAARLPGKLDAPRREDPRSTWGAAPDVSLAVLMKHTVQLSNNLNKG